jgi:hypothetical protein
MSIIRHIQEIAHLRFFLIPCDVVNIPPACLGGVTIPSVAKEVFFGGMFPGFVILIIHTYGVKC